MTAKTKTHRYRVTLDLNDPEERALSDLLDALKPRNNGRTSFQRLALINYMSMLVHMDLNSVESLEEAQLAVLAQMILKGRGLEERQRSAVSSGRCDAASESAWAGGVQSVAADPQYATDTAINEAVSTPAGEDDLVEIATMNTEPGPAPEPPPATVSASEPKPSQTPTTAPKSRSPLKSALASIM